MQVIRVGWLVIRPSVAFLVEIAEAQGRLTFLGRPPMVIIIIGIMSGFTGFLEPRMLVAGMVYYQVQYQSHLPFMNLFQEAVEIFHRTEFSHDFPIVADVVTIIIGGREKDRV